MTAETHRDAPRPEPIPVIDVQFRSADPRTTGTLTVSADRTPADPAIGPYKPMRRPNRTRPSGHQD